jgi:hypothetical protein
MEGSRQRQRAIARLLLAVMAALALAALAQPALADGEPTPLPDALSGPSVESLLGGAAVNELDCELFSAPPNGEQWSCNRQAAKDLYYIASFPAESPLVMQLFVSGPLPWPDDHDQFLLDMATAFCAPESIANILSFIQLVRDSTPESLTFEDPACILRSDYMTVEIPVQQLIAYAKVDPATLPTAPPLPTATPLVSLPPTPSPSPFAAPTSTVGPSPTPIVELPLPNDGGSNDLGGFAKSVAAPTAVSVDPLVLAESFGLALLVVLLMPFPAQLFNSTYETHHKDVSRFFRLDTLQRAMGPLSGFWDSLVGILLFIVLSGVVYALLDPNLSLSPAGLATILGLALGILITALLASAPSLIDSVRSKQPFRMRALPATLLIGLACVVISRLTGFLPGYVYGVILGFVFARELSRLEQGRANALAAAAMLVVALISWLLLGFVASSGLGLLGVILGTVLATLLVACLEGVVFGLLPFRFLPGEPLYATNRLIWGGLLFVGAFCFFHILINPASGYLSSSARTPLLTIVALFVGFAALSLAFWGYFRNKPVNAE